MTGFSRFRESTCLERLKSKHPYISSYTMPPDDNIGESENFHWLLDNSPDGIVIARDGETLYVNHRMAEILGDTIENVIKASNYEYLHPDSVETVKSRTISRISGEDVPHRYEVKVQRKDGFIRLVETNAVKIVWEGKPASLSINRDITDVKTLEAKFEALLGHAAAMSMAETIEDIAVITKDTVTKTIGFNRLSIGLVIGENLVHRYRWGINSKGDFVMPLNGPGITVSAINTKETQNIGIIHSDSDFVDGVGNMSTRSELAVPVIIDNEAVVVLNLESENENAFSESDQRLVEAFAQQVASAMRRIKAQENQRELAKTYNAFMSSASESFAFFDPDLTYIEINEIGAQRLGYTRTELIGKNMRDVIPGIIESGRYDKYLEIIETGEPLIFDALHHVSGIEHLRINAFKVGNGLGLIATDLSELKKEQDRRRRLDKELVEERLRTEQLIEINRLKTNFMNTAAHEIRTPITSVRGYSEIILGLIERNDLEQIKPHFDAVIRNIDRLEILSRDLLDMQRLESGKLVINRKEVSINAILEQLESEMIPIILKKEQILDIDNLVEGSEIYCDELRVLQVLINLVHNASKYSDYGSTISLVVADEGDAVSFSVRDNGLGLSKEDLNKLFTPFPDIRIRNASHGSGLGLSISKGIIDLHGGIIKAESIGPGKGSTFKFVLPKQ